MSFNEKRKAARERWDQAATTIEKMLEENADKFPAWTETIENELERDRIQPEAEVTEGQLNSRQVGTKEEVTEAKLDTEKSMFSDFRQCTSGDIPKLEEKRLANDPVEKEKYKSAVQ